MEEYVTYCDTIKIPASQPVEGYDPRKDPKTNWVLDYAIELERIQESRNHVLVDERGHKSPVLTRGTIIDAIWKYLKATGVAPLIPSEPPTPCSGILASKDICDREGQNANTITSEPTKYVRSSGVIAKVSDHVTLYQDPSRPYCLSTEPFAAASPKPEGPPEQQSSAREICNCSKANYAHYRSSACADAAELKADKSTGR